MTWIVGTVQPFGFSILVSDICVTFTDCFGRELYCDCLQKIYPLGRFSLGGFAGSVDIGFQILDGLSLEFAKAPDSTQNVQRLAYTWAPRLIRRCFRAAPEQEQSLGCEIILASAHPTKNRGDAPWPWTDIHTFSSPKFEPVAAPLMDVIAN